MSCNQCCSSHDWCLSCYRLLQPGSHAPVTPRDICRCSCEGCSARNWGVSAEGPASLSQERQPPCTHPHLMITNVQKC